MKRVGPSRAGALLRLKGRLATEAAALRHGFGLIVG
jgi:hypothetical protein